MTATDIKPERTFQEWKKEAQQARKDYLKLAEELERNWPVWSKQQRTYKTKDEACKAILGVTAAALRMRKARERAKEKGEKVAADDRTSKRNAVTPAENGAESHADGSENGRGTATYEQRFAGVVKAVMALADEDRETFKLLVKRMKEYERACLADLFSVGLDVSVSRLESSARRNSIPARELAAAR